MASMAQDMVRDSLTAFVNRDADLAKEICRRDDAGIQDPSVGVKARAVSADDPPFVNGYFRSKTIRPSTIVIWTFPSCRAKPLNAPRMPLSTKRLTRGFALHILGCSVLDSFMLSQSKTDTKKTWRME
jgi:hypothetical protein